MAELLVANQMVAGSTPVIRSSPAVFVTQVKESILAYAKWTKEFEPNGE